MSKPPVEQEVSLQDSLLWCIKNRGEISMMYDPDVGYVAFHVQVNNIFAEYEIDKPVTPESVGAALLQSIHAVEHGTRFHQKFGDFPPIDPTLSDGPPGYNE